MKPYINLRLTLISVFVYSLLFSVSSCKKEEKRDCEENNYGWLSFTNLSTTQYVSINHGTATKVKPQNTWKAQLTPGTHLLKVVRWDLTDSSEQQVTIKQCDSTKVWY